jgi:hypothetical protein
MSRYIYISEEYYGSEGVLGSAGAPSVLQLDELPFLLLLQYDIDSEAQYFACLNTPSTDRARPSEFNLFLPFHQHQSIRACNRPGSYRHSSGLGFLLPPILQYQMHTCDHRFPPSQLISKPFSFPCTSEINEPHPRLSFCNRRTGYCNRCHVS